MGARNVTHLLMQTNLSMACGYRSLDQRTEPSLGACCTRDLSCVRGTSGGCSNKGKRRGSVTIAAESHAQPLTAPPRHSTGMCVVLCGVVLCDVCVYGGGLEQLSILHDFLVTHLMTVLIRTAMVAALIGNSAGIGANAPSAEHRSGSLS